jgi:hypothetical protein
MAATMAGRHESLVGRMDLSGGGRRRILAVRAGRAVLVRRGNIRRRGRWIRGQDLTSHGRMNLRRKIELSR